MNPDKHRVKGDPHFLKRANTKSAHARKGRDDKGFTPTEQRKRDQLMKQFCKLEGVNGNTAAYVNSAVWCHCGRLNGTHAH